MEDGEAQLQRLGDLVRKRRHERTKEKVNTPRRIAQTWHANSGEREVVLQGSRSIACYEILNHIEEGSYGVVSRARDRSSDRIYALKKIKFDRNLMGFPITSLREIHTLMACREHPHIVHLEEVVVGHDLGAVYLAMEFVEHDVKTLLQAMSHGFILSEVKTLSLQLFSAVAFMHDQWIIHRDLKTSNLLINNRGHLKIADFGLARTLGDPPGHLTQLVVTLWYRAPEILLGAKVYTTAIDMWSVGCIVGELITGEPLLPGDSEIHQLHNIFTLLGHPNATTWPDFETLPRSKLVNFKVQPFSTLRQRFATFSKFTELGLDLVKRLLSYDPRARLAAADAKVHAWFDELPAPKHPDFFTTFPSVAAGERVVKKRTPGAPVHGGDATDDPFPFV